MLLKEKKESLQNIHSYVVHFCECAENIESFLYILWLGGDVLSSYLNITLSRKRVCSEIEMVVMEKCKVSELTEQNITDEEKTAAATRTHAQRSR